MISTIDRVSSGEIFIEGARLTEMEEKLANFRRDQLGFIFQEYNLLDTLTIGENILLPLNLQRKSHEDADRELVRVSEALGVSDQLSKFPYELSGDSVRGRHVPGRLSRTRRWFWQMNRQAL